MKVFKSGFAAWLANRIVLSLLLDFKFHKNQKIVRSYEPRAHEGGPSSVKTQQGLRGGGWVDREEGEELLVDLAGASFTGSVFYTVCAWGLGHEDVGTRQRNVS